MARARNIKPAFFKNEELADSSFETRLLFIGLWTLADREGRLEDRPRRIRAEIFPFDGIDVEPMLAELERLGFLVRYEVDSERFIHITNFVKHQDPHYREKASDIPPMPGTENQILATGVTRTQRARILKRDDGKCQHCGSTDHPCIDHVIPVSRGGDSSDENLQVLCLPCNTKKGNKIDSTSNQHQVDIDSTKEALVPLIPDSLIPDSLSSDSLIPDPLTPSPAPGAVGEAKPDLFARFWGLYPNKKGKTAAEKAWQKLKVTEALFAEIADGLGRYCVSREWTKDGGQYIPHPATWLNGKRWQDEVRPAGKAGNVHHLPNSNHTGFEDRNYFDGLTKREDGTYGLA